MSEEKYEERKASAKNLLEIFHDTIDMIAKKEQQVSPDEVKRIKDKAAELIDIKEK